MMKTASSTPTAYYIGLMSGTSLDGIDAALVSITPGAPPKLLATTAVTMPDTLHALLLHLCHAPAAHFAELAAAEDAFCRLQAQAVTARLT